MILQLPKTLHVTVPEAARSLAGFRQWAASKEFPESAKIAFLAGELYIDLNPEMFDSHNQVKNAVNRTLSQLVFDRDLGKYCPDGLWITNDEADLSTEADATFFSWERLESGEVQLIPGSRAHDGIEMRGSPDWVLEIVSDTSERKDTVRLLGLYFRANVREYWLIDARGEAIHFRLYRRSESAFVATEPAGGWLNSEVFQGDFRLIRNRDRLGGWSYSLEMRSTAQPAREE
jgi:Uma2 family endonuclease